MHWAAPRLVKGRTRNGIVLDLVASANHEARLILSVDLPHRNTDGILGDGAASDAHVDASGIMLNIFRFAALEDGDNLRTPDIASVRDVGHLDNSLHVSSKHLIRFRDRFGDMG